MINKVLYCLNTVCHLKNIKLLLHEKLQLYFSNRGIHLQTLARNEFTKWRRRTYRYRVRCPYVVLA
jgi:hypothetical protein